MQSNYKVGRNTDIRHTKIISLKTNYCHVDKNNQLTLKFIIGPGCISILDPLLV